MVLNEGPLGKAYDIAKRDLRACYTSKGILAGLKRFDDYWARDSFFASFGSLALKDNHIVRNNLELFLKYQNAHGQIPRRIDRHYVSLKYWGPKLMRKELSPRYTTSLLYCYSVDQNSLFIISLLEYVKRAKDIRFLKSIFNKVKKAIDWNFSNDRERDLMLEEGFFANWEDTIFWRGKLLYTNILHYKALVDFAELSKIVGSESYQRYLDIAEKVKEKINSQMWNTNHYMKSGIRQKRYMKYFCIDANMLAIVFGIADKDRSEKILQHLVSLGLDKEMPLRSTWPRYPLWKISPTRILIFSTGYHDSFGWLWVSCLYALALHKLGRKKEAMDYMEKVASKINEFDGVYEVYSKGRPLNNILVKSDYPFAWSAGMFLYSYSIISQH